MARLAGFIANRPDVGARMLAREGASLVARPREGITPGWGLGFHHAGDLLLKRRPIEDRRELRVAELVRDVRADVLVAHVRTATVGPLRTENTHPFRHRQWLFAQTGTVAATPAIRARMLESLPGFLQRSVRGETDSEVFFFLVLSFMHDAGVLDRSDTSAEATREALRSTVALIERLHAEEGVEPGPQNALLASPDALFLLAAGAPAAHKLFRGADFASILGEGELGRMRVPDYASSQLSLVASDFDGAAPASWRAVPERCIGTFRHTGDPTFEPL